MNDVLHRDTDLSEAEVDWLHLLVGDWQLIADLSFADLVLWAPTREDDWVAVAHVRPTTGVGVFSEDLVGTLVTPARAVYVRGAFADRAIVRAPMTVWRDDMPVREEAIPVVRSGQPIAVLTRHTNLASMRTPSRLEVTYLATADALARMIAAGDFPGEQATGTAQRGAPRVGDGVLRLDAEGAVTYASPNAVSAMHRLGHEAELVGAPLAELVRALLPPRPWPDEDLEQVLRGRVASSSEIETRSAHVTLRGIPLLDRGRRIGAVLLVRDVSELRRRERELLTKDATIREIHHRVKNNLQTVAAVLRLQGRRVSDPAGQAALRDAERRVATIAAVHETLSGRLDDAVDFDEIAARGLTAALDIGSRSGAQLRGRIEGRFGVLCSEDATSMAMILAELIQNAIEHGVADGGEVVVTARRTEDASETRLEVEVRDDGGGLPEDFDPGRAGLGVQIVRSLVADLRGTISWSRPQEGTAVMMTALLRDRPAAAP
ncbi:sensor histidine kinase [Metallococcus carri]|nr:PAS domain-containing sensor histidine kinase [Metallococcus carri]